MVLSCDLNSRAAIRGLSRCSPVADYDRALSRSGVILVARLQNASPNPLRHLWNYGVAESPKSVHPTGNPISHSTYTGFRTVRWVLSPVFGLNDRTCVANPSPELFDAPLRL